MPEYVSSKSVARFRWLRAWQAEFRCTSHEHQLSEELSFTEAPIANLRGLRANVSPWPRLARKWDQVLDADLLEFQEQGFDNTSMNQIAARAEVSKRTLFKYFPHKTDLFRHAMSKNRHLLMEYSIDDLNLEKDIFPNFLHAVSSFTLRFTNPTFVDLARLVVREAIQNETLIEKIIANPQNSAVRYWLSSFNLCKMLEKFLQQLIWLKNSMAILNSDACGPVSYPGTFLPKPKLTTLLIPLQDYLNIDLIDRRKNSRQDRFRSVFGS